MALIKCPECHREVSDRATACPNCGCPISGPQASTDTIIKIGDIFYPTNDWAIKRAQAKTSVEIINAGTKQVLGSGTQGSVLRFQLKSSTMITIAFSTWPHSVLYEGRISPNKRYELVKLPAFIKGKWTLNEIDVIDSRF